MRAHVRKIILDILKPWPAVIRMLRKIFSIFSSGFRIVILSGKSIPRKRFNSVKMNSYNNNVISDLVAYTGFTEQMLRPYVLRKPKHHFESEFNWYHPIDQQELSWFYRCSSAYIFANAIHAYDARLDIITSGIVLDYGAGIGCNTIHLAKKGIRVDFIEINRLQADFIRFRAQRHGLNNIAEVLPSANGRFNPVECITATYDAIIAIDVLEHIPDYHIAVRHFIDRLNPGGMIFESTPFDSFADDIAIHLRQSVPIEVAMDGMERIDVGIWKKKS